MWMVWGQRDNVCVREEFRFNKRNETKYKKLFKNVPPNELESIY